MSARHLKRTWVMLLLSLLAGTAGCLFSSDGKNDDPEENPPPSDYKPQITIANVLYNFKLAFEELNYEEYEKLLHEDFAFVFDPRDVGPDKPWSEATWGRDDELECIRNMFSGEPNINGQVVDGISLRFDAGDPEPSSENEDWWMVRLTAVDLSVYATEQHSGDQWILQTPGGYEGHLHFIQTDGSDQGTVERIWKIIMWEDKPPSTKILVAVK